jgi:methyl-accepting chemotaxis protein
LSGVAAAIEEQGAATQEISRNVQQAAQGTPQVSGSDRLKSEVAKFLVSVRGLRRGRPASASGKLKVPYCYDLRDF